MNKSDLIALIQKQHDDRAAGAVAAVDAEYQPLLDAANALEVPSDSDLQKQIDDLKVQLQAAQDAKAQEDIDLESIKVALQKDESLLAKLREFLAQ